MFLQKVKKNGRARKSWYSTDKIVNKDYSSGRTGCQVRCLSFVVCCSSCRFPFAKMTKVEDTDLYALLGIELSADASEVIFLKLIILNTSSIIVN